MITDLQSHPINPHLLLSASKDNTVRLWHVGLEKCLAEYSVEATVLVSRIGFFYQDAQESWS